MKRIIMLLLALVLILAGCGSSSYTEQDLIDNGFTINEKGNYMLSVTDDSDVFVTVDENGTTPTGISIQVYPSEYQTVQLKYLFENNGWTAYYFIDDGEDFSISLDPNDAYEYVKAFSPNAVEELDKLIDSENISTAPLEGGDISVVEEYVTPVIQVSNLKVSTSTYTNEYMEEDFVNNEYFLQVNFDITNNSDKTINFGDLYLDLCYEISTGEDCQWIMGSVGIPGDSEVYEQTLNSGATTSLQYTVVVPGDASNFHLKIYSNDEVIYYESDKVNNASKN